MSSEDNKKSFDDLDSETKDKLKDEELEAAKALKTLKEETGLEITEEDLKEVRKLASTAVNEVADFAAEASAGIYKAVFKRFWPLILGGAVVVLAIITGGIWALLEIIEAIKS